MADDKTRDRDDRKQGDHDQGKPGRVTDGLVRKVMGWFAALSIAMATAVAFDMYLFVDLRSEDIDAMFVYFFVIMFLVVVVKYGRKGRKQGNHDQDKPGRLTDGFLRKVMGGVVGLSLATASAVAIDKYVFIDGRSVNIEVVFACLLVSMFVTVVISLVSDAVMGAVAGWIVGFVLMFEFGSEGAFFGVFVGSYVYWMVAAPTLYMALCGAIVVLCLSLVWFFG